MRVERLKSGQAGNLEKPAPIGTVITDEDPKGFGVLVGASGRSFIVRFRVRGQPTQYTRNLGSIDEIKLVDARAEAHRIKIMAKGNRGTRTAPRHPDQDEWDRQAEARAKAAAEAKARAVAEKAAGETFKAVADRYLADEGKHGGASLAASTRHEYGQKLKSAALQPWHDRPIGEISLADIDAVVELKGKTAKVAANRLLAFIKVVFAYAKRKRLIEINPALDAERQFDERGRERKLSDAEIAIFWEACGKLDEPMGRFYRLLLVLGQRRGEVAGMRRAELAEPIALTRRDYGSGRTTTLERRLWKLPGSRTKNGKPHTVPLPDLAVELIEAAPVLKGADDKPFDHLLATGAAGDQGPSGWSKFRSYLDKAIAGVMTEKAEQLAALAEPPFAEPWHVHDLRATVVSRMEQDLGVPEYITARVLNHSPGGGITRTYIRNKYDYEAAEALQAWADLIKTIAGLNVEPFPKRKRRGA